MTSQSSLLSNYFTKTKESERSSAAIAYLAALDHLRSSNPPVAAAIEQELKDQRSHLKLIASENFSSLATQLAMGNLLTDKYAEGYPGHRFYAGCGNVDSVESQAADELRSLFKADYAYVQPHSGADANLVAFWSILIHKIQSKELEKLNKKKLEDLTPEEYETVRHVLNSQKLLGMSLNSGGHLTHGYRHNVSSKMMQSFAYDVDPKTGLLDYKALETQAKEVRPTILLAGYSAYPRRIDFAAMREIADKVGAVFMVDMAHFAGLVAGKVFKGKENPVAYADIVTSTSHKTMRGPRGGFILAKEEFGETLNKGCPLVLGGPLPHVLAAKAVAFKEANSPAFEKYAHKIVENAQTLAAELVRLGASVLTGGTDNHLAIVDVSPYGLTGRQAELALREVSLTLNRNAIPFDKNGPWYTSGIRIGTPAVTTLGMGASEMKKIASILVRTLKATTPGVDKTGKTSLTLFKIDPAVQEACKKEMAELLKSFPLYPEIVI